ncbi:MAG: transcription termination/antitermination protein NusG [Planctomycetota bacterium]|nr:transcription termination/antitermination protein NusG [Planctomycetota bacterium]
MNISNENTNEENVEDVTELDSGAESTIDEGNTVPDAQQPVIDSEKTDSENLQMEPDAGTVSDEPLADLDDQDLDGEYEEDEFEGDVDPIEDVSEETEEEVEKNWYILKVQVNREKGICDALERRVKMHGLESQFGDILVPTEDIKEFTKTGKQRIVKRKLYPGYIVVNMAINDETWFIVRETPGIGDFTGSAGKPAPVDANEVEKILKLSRPVEVGETREQEIKNSFPFKVGDQVRVNEGNFQSLEGGVETIDESNGRITVILNMFGRPTPVQLDHWQVEKV